jgi:chromate transporter
MTSEELSQAFGVSGELWSIVVLFGRLGLAAFGSGSSILSEMDRETVARGWVDHAQFVQAFAISQLTPGPQVLYTTIIGYFAAGYPGAILATVAFCLPPGILTVILASLWSRRSTSPWPGAVRRALGPVALGLVAASSYALAPAALASPWAMALAVLGFLALNIYRRLSPLWIVATGAIVGAVFGGAV